MRRSRFGARRQLQSSGVVWGGGRAMRGREAARCKMRRSRCGARRQPICKQYKLDQLLWK